MTAIYRLLSSQNPLAAWIDFVLFGSTEHKTPYRPNEYMHWKKNRAGARPTVSFWPKPHLPSSRKEWCDNCEAAKDDIQVFKSLYSTTRSPRRRVIVKRSRPHLTSHRFSRIPFSLLWWGQAGLCAHILTGPSGSTECRQRRPAIHACSSVTLNAIRSEGDQWRHKKSQCVPSVMAVSRF